MSVHCTMKGYAADSMLEPVANTGAIGVGRVSEA